MDFREMAAKAGYKPKLTWTVGEVSIITGIPVSTVRDCIWQSNSRQFGM